MQKKEAHLVDGPIPALRENNTAQYEWIFALHEEFAEPTWRSICDQSPFVLRRSASRPGLWHGFLARRKFRLSLQSVAYLKHDPHGRSFGIVPAS